MLHTLFSAIVICVLVVVGLTVFDPFGFRKGEPAGRTEATEGRARVRRMLWKTLTAGLLLLGCAFVAGALLAYLQGVLAQIAVLAVVGGICLLSGALCFLMGRSGSAWKPEQEGRK